MKRALLVLAGLVILAGTSWADYVILRINLSASEAGPKANPPGDPNAGSPMSRPPRAFGGAPRTSPLPGYPGVPGMTNPSGKPANVTDPAAKPVWFITVVNANSVKLTPLRHFDVDHTWDGVTRLPKVIYSGAQTAAPGSTPQPGAYGGLPGQPGAYGRKSKKDDKAAPPEPPVTNENLVVKVDVIFKSTIDMLLPRWEAKKRDLMDSEPKGSKTLSLGGWLKMAEWTLQHWNMPLNEATFGDRVMQKQFESIIDDMVKIAPKDPRVQALVAARAQVRKPLPDAGAEYAHLRTLLGSDYYTIPSAHYVMLTRIRETKEMEQKLNRLEYAYAGFYYWFALQNRPQPAPAKKLLCIYADNDRTFKQIHAMFDALPMVADGFYSRFDNIAVFAPTRFDNPFQQLRAVASAIEGQGLDLDELLRGERRSKDSSGGKDDQNKVMYGRALALGMKAGLEEGEIAAFTHEGVQQLGVAAGAFPPRLQLPRAVRFGFGSFFETPKSAMFPVPDALSKTGYLELPSMWSGIGQVSWTYLPTYRAVAAVEGRELTVDAGTTNQRTLRIGALGILNIITDQNWDAAERAQREDREFLREKAKAEAWALTYYLAREKLDGLLKFYAELGHLPRDMELTDEMIAGAFGRAFDLMERGDAYKIDKAKLAALEASWKKFMSFQALEYTPPAALSPKPPPAAPPKY